MISNSTLAMSLKRFFNFIYMKLFITNKKEFQENFYRKDYVGGFYKTPKQIHQSAYNNLLKSVSDNNIPIFLDAPYKDFGLVLFEFKSKKNDIYFYEFSSTAS